MEKNLFNHYLITRFSYPEDYPHLNKRFELFLKYTLPSVQNQICKDFKWFIQTNNPEWFEGLDCLTGSIKDLETLISNNDTEWTISTRLDNDDSIHPLMIRDIQKAFEPKEKVIDFRGYRINHNTDKVVFWDKYEVTPSPFATLLQKSGDIGRGIMNFKHGDLHNHFPVQRIDKFRWCQVIHDTNKLMRWKGSDNYYEVGRGALWI